MAGQLAFRNVPGKKHDKEHDAGAPNVGLFSVIALLVCDDLWCCIRGRADLRVVWRMHMHHDVRTWLLGIESNCSCFE